MAILFLCIGVLRRTASRVLSLPWSSSFLYFASLRWSGVDGSLVVCCCSLSRFSWMYLLGYLLFSMKLRMFWNANEEPLPPLLSSPLLSSECCWSAGATASFGSFWVYAKLLVKGKRSRVLSSLSFWS